jgi:hypothetical protein
LQIFHGVSEKVRRISNALSRGRIFGVRRGETGRTAFDSLPVVRSANQDGAKVGLERSLRRWLDSHGLFAITATVLGIIVALSLLLVVGGYLYVTP